jgi:hypothetical protein
MDCERRLFCWIAVGLPLPQGMEPVTLDKDFFRLADHTGLEIAVRSTKGLKIEDNAGMLRILKRRLSSLSVEFEEDALPAPLLSAAWDRQDSDSGVLVAPFATAGKTKGAFGAAFHFFGSACTLTALCNGPDEEACLDAALKCIHEIRDLSMEKPVPWAVFDVRFALPQELAYRKSLFRPGHYKLEFSGLHTELSLEFLGPAEVLLKKKSLPEWAANHFELPENPSLAGSEKAGEFYAQLTEEPKGRLLRFGKKKPRLIRAHARRSKRNKIICAALFSGSAKEACLDEEAFSMFCRGALHVP